MEILKVSKDSVPKSVAGAIAGIIRNGNVAEIDAIGAAAVNQAVKSIAVARGYVSPNGIDIVAMPSFSRLIVEGQEKTAIKFTVERKVEA